MFDVKNVSENLQSPKYRHWQQVKRTVRYLAGTRDYVQKIEVNSEVKREQDCANEHSLVGWLTTSCAVLRLDGAVTHTHSRKQTLIATSTAEAEMCGICRSHLRVFDWFTFLRELGSSVELTTMTDSDAGRAVCSRKVWEAKTRKHQISVDSRCSGQEEGHVETTSR